MTHYLAFITACELYFFGDAARSLTFHHSSSATLAIITEILPNFTNLAVITKIL